MRNKKISALLLVMAMLLALVVPVQAETTETLTLLTQNAIATEEQDQLDNMLTQEEYNAFFGKTVNAYPEGWAPTVSTTSIGSMAQAGSTFTSEDVVKKRVFDGAISQDQIWNWASPNANATITIDLGAAQDVKTVAWWVMADDTDSATNTMTGDIDVAYTDTLWETFKDGHDFTAYTISTSTDGSTFTEAVTGTPTTATVDNTFLYYKSNERTTVDKVYHGYKADLPSTQNVRYVRIALKQTDHQIRTSEFMILGDVTAKETREVLSGNQFSDANLAKISKFAGFDIALGKKGLTSTVSVNNMANNNLGALESAPKVTDGVVDQTALWTHWNMDEDAIYTIDLGTAQELRGLLVFENVWDGNSDPSYTVEEWATVEAEKIEEYKDKHGISKVTIKVSDDGEAWSEAVYDADPRKTATADNTFIYSWNNNGAIVFDKIAHGHACTFTPVTARYVQVILDEVGGTNGNIMLTEMAVIGTQTNLIKKQVVSGQSIVDKSGYTNMAGWYEKYGIGLTSAGTTATMLYDEADVDSVGRDGSLYDGFITVWTGPTGGTECTSTKWTISPVNMYVTFDQEVIVDGVDVWATDMTNRWTKQIDIYKSADGVEWELVGSQLNPNTMECTSTQEQELISYTCEPFKTKYLRVDALRGSYQNVIGEIVVFGSVPPTATAPVFVDAAGGDYVDSWGDNGLYAKTTFTGADGVLVAAWYDVSKEIPVLKNVWVQNGEAGVETSLEIANSENTLASDIYLSVEDGTGELKAFAFDSLTAITPLGVTEFNLGE